jgi:hypothetical protein
LLLIVVGIGLVISMAEVPLIFVSNEEEIDFFVKFNDLEKN